MIAMANPNDSDMVEELRLLVKAPVVVAATEPVALRRMIATLYGSSKTPVAEPVRAVPDAEPLATITFTCPGCQQELQLRAAPWVMTEVNRDPGRYYVWDCEPGVAGPAHICGRT